MREAVPASVRGLIRDRVDALEQLEILLLLHEDPRRAWSVDELTKQLSISTILVEAALAHLTHHRFLTAGDERYRYEPGDDELARSVDDLARSYDDARADVLASISSDAVGRVRRRVRQLMDRLKT